MGRSPRSRTSTRSRSTRPRSRRRYRRSSLGATGHTPTSCTRAASRRRSSPQSTSTSGQARGGRPIRTTPGRRKTGNVVGLADGSTMIWDKSPAPILVDHDAPLHFVVTDPSGRPARLEPYMGMAGHAMITRDDGAVFVHLHPAGTVSLAALETFALRQPGDTVRGLLAARLTEMEKGAGSREQRAVPGGATPITGAHRGEPLPAPGSLSFPYAFPKPGRYRIWVQVKRSGRILTGVFDADVRPAR